MNKQYDDWLALRKRLHAEERAFAAARESLRRGDQSDLETMSVKESELRALRALSRTLMRRAVASTSTGPR